MQDAQKMNKITPVFCAKQRNFVFLGFVKLHKKMPFIEKIFVQFDEKEKAARAGQDSGRMPEHEPQIN